MRYPVTLIAGDGIGPEVTAAAVKAMAATGVPIEWDPVELNAHVIEAQGKALPDPVVDSLLRTRLAEGSRGDPCRRRVSECKRSSA